MIIPGRELLNLPADELRAIAVSSEPSELQETFDRISAAIRDANLYAGEPRNAHSARCVSLARAGLQLATHSRDDRFLLDALRLMARCLTANEEYEEAISHYEKLIAHLEAAGEAGQAARSRLGYIVAMSHAGRHRDALDIARVAENWFVRNHDEIGLARLCTNIAILHARLDEPTEAYRCHLKAIETFEKVGDQQAMAQSYLNLGNLLACVDQFEESDKMYVRSEELARQLGLLDLSAQSDYNRAYLQFLRGRYSDALQGFGRLRQHFEENGSERHFALCDLDEAEIYLQLNLSRDAGVLAVRAASRFKQIGMATEEAKATAFYGMSLVQSRRFADAIDVFGAAQKIYEGERNLYWIGLLDLYRAEVHFSLKRLWEAQSLATRAKSVLEQAGFPSKQILSLVLLGRIALALGDVSAAERCTEQIRTLIGETKIPLVLFDYFVLCAEIAERQCKWGEAEGCYEMAVADIEQHQSRLHHDELRVTFFKGRYQAYDALVRLSLNKTSSSEALSSAYAWCERAKSRCLIELLSHHMHSVQAHTHASLFTKINRLREELNVYYVRSQPETRPLPSLSNFEVIAIKENELARTLREVSVVDPEYASLQQVSIATLETVQQNLPADTTLIEYFTVQDEVLAFVITRQDAKVVRRLCPESRVLGVRERLLFQLEKFLLGEDYLRAHSQQILRVTNRHLNDLYLGLIAPFAADLQTRKLIMVPHGMLHFLPFHAFFDGEKYLIDDFEVSYAPSASVLKYCLEKADIHQDSPFLVGVADENAPLVADEIGALNRVFPEARVLRDGDATCAAFKGGAASASFLHIATHATFRHDNPMFSGFKLADGWLTALDLFSMNCQTNLVTLSACESGVSQVSGSDDLMGLMRGFLYAGARSLLLSLWNVNDRSTAALMIRFYKEWKEGASKAKALQTAMLALRDEYPNPFYWAPFLLIGKA